VVGVLHGDGLSLEVKLGGERSDLAGVVVGHKNVAFHACQQVEQAAVLNIPVGIETFRGDGVRRIAEECSRFVVGVPPDHFKRVAFNK